MQFKITAAAFLVLAASGVFVSMLHAQSTRTVWDGVYSEDQATKGADLYAQHCASCHGGSLEGGDVPPALAGADFLSNWNGLTAGDLFERIRVTMPLDKPQTLSRDVNSAILAFMFQVNKFPAGKAAMPGQSEVLKEIQIQPKKQ
jgi:cytochrome c